MRTTFALLGLAATLVTAETKEPSKKFTLSISSPNNTLAGPNQTSIDGLGVMADHLEYVTMGGVFSVSSLGEKPTEFWLNSKGWLTDAEKNSTLRHAYVRESDYNQTSPASYISVDQLNNNQLDTDKDPLVWLEWEITSDKFLVPAGKLKGLPWFFCKNIPEYPGDGTDENLYAGLVVGWINWSHCIKVEGLKVTESDSLVQYSNIALRIGI